MAIFLKELHTKKQLRAFVKFPFSLYKDNPYWVPPIIKEEVNSFDVNKNPVFKHATARFFLAYKEGKVAGRIATIINYFETQQQQIKKMRFGWFDVIDDINVTKALIAKVQQIGREHQLEYLEGPVGFSNLDKAGVLVEGFNHIGTMITWYNHPYYKEHLEQLGFVKAKAYLEKKILFSNINPINFNRVEKIIRKRYGLKPLNFSSTKKVLPYITEMFELFSESYRKLASFVPISNEQIDYFKEKYISFINPEYIKFVADESGKLVAFAIVMPSFSESLQKARGKLFPFGIFHLLKARKQSKDVIFYLIGVAPAYQNKGVTAILFNEFHKTFTKKGIVNCIRTPELEENKAIDKIWRNFNPVIYKKRRTYKLPL